jgi:uncharacterized protein (TIGR02246 family)
MREQVIQVVEQYIDAVRHNDTSALPLHHDAICEFPTSTYRGAAAFQKGLDDFARVVKSIEVIRLVVDGEHCVAILNIDTVFGVIPFAEHIHVKNGQIVSIRGYCDPRPMLGAMNAPAGSTTDRRGQMDAAQLRTFGTKYTAAWCSHEAESVAALYAENGFLTINGGTPSVGRTAIAAAAQDFMTAFPDMVVAMDDVSLQGDNAVYRWTLTGANAGPGGTGKAVRISGYEEWTFGPDGLIAESKGHFDEAEYQRQLRVGGAGVA